ncbi:carboxylesterase 1 [Hirschfeldia incana]|nr:carboxylesterase 1 [Hirschfeldia incana]
MDSDNELAYDYSPRFRVYKNGRIQRLATETFVPPSLTPQNGVVSKDAVYSPEKNLSLRIYLPHQALETGDEKKKKKLPLLVYFHGGAFIMETPFSPAYNTFLTSTVSTAGCIAVSVDYRRAPEHPIPVPYEDSWDAVEWVFTHIAGSGPEEWVNEHADFGIVFIAGDSAGANIAHHMTIRAGKEENGSIRISGMALFHPFFLSRAIVEEQEDGVRRYMEGIWEVACPSSEEGVEDPWINVVRSDLSGLGCGRVLVMLAGRDVLAEGGRVYAEKLEKSGWGGGRVEVVETEDEDHVFHIRNPDSVNARLLVQRFAEFVVVTRTFVNR